MSAAQRTTIALLAACVTLAIAGLAQAAVITPNFAEGTAADYGSPALLINGAGLIGAGPVLTRQHQTIHTQGWLISNTNPANELIFAMPGGPANLSGMHVWQYSQGACCTGRGVSQFDALFSFDGGNTYPVTVSGLTLNPASGVSNEMAQSISFAPQTGVTHVKINNMKDFPSLPAPGWQGLNELRFEGAAAPVAGGHFGNTISFRSAASDGAADVLWTNGYGAPVDGTVSSIRLANERQPGSYQSELFQLRPTGVANQYDVIARSGAMSPPGSGAFGEVQIALPTPLTLRKGDLIAHYGRGIPYDQNLTSSAAHNNQVIYWSSPVAPGVGAPITLGSGGFPVFAQWRDYAYSFDLPGFTETVGNGAGQGNSGPDGATNLLVVMENDPFTQEGSVRTWQFFNDTAGTGGRLVTPALLRNVGGALEVIGLGATRTGTANGFQQYDFGLVAGTDWARPGDLFGFYYGNQSGGNAGSIEYTDIGGSPLTVRLFADANGIRLGDQYSAAAYTLTRFYSVNATTIVPEPSTFALAALGLAGLGLLGLRRRRARG